MTIPKYRAYNKQLKKMMPVLEINLDPEFGGVFVWGKAYYDADTGEHEADKDFWPWSDIELMQYVMQDRHGKEVYENDLVQLPNTSKHGIVKWNTSKPEFYVYGPDGADYALHGDYEVIGTIWQQSTE